MLDGVRLKVLKNQIKKKDKEIADLTERNKALEKESAALREQAAAEREKVESAAKTATETIEEYRDKILEVNKLHQKFLRLIEETRNINENYRGKFDELISVMQKTEEGD